MIELVYVSRANSHYGQAELIQLLEQARDNNAHNGITGLLLYDNKGTFIQALEGDEQQIDALFKKIQQDPRHSRVNRVSKKSIQSRSFADWQMGFKLIDGDVITTLPGFSTCMQQRGAILGFSDITSSALDLLNYFKRCDMQHLIER